jgi:hypothetical protein
VRIAYQVILLQFAPNLIKEKKMATIVENIQQRYKKSLLSKKEAARELNISIATLDRLRAQGLIKSKKIKH